MNDYKYKGWEYGRAKETLSYFSTLEEVVAHLEYIGANVSLDVLQRMLKDNYGAVAYIPNDRYIYMIKEIKYEEK